MKLISVLTFKSMYHLFSHASYSTTDTDTMEYLPVYVYVFYSLYLRMTIHACPWKCNWRLLLVHGYIYKFLWVYFITDT